MLMLLYVTILLLVYLFEDL